MTSQEDSTEPPQATPPSEIPPENTGEEAKKPTPFWFRILGSFLGVFGMLLSVGVIELIFFAFLEWETALKFLLWGGGLGAFLGFLDPEEAVFIVIEGLFKTVVRLVTRLLTWWF